MRFADTTRGGQPVRILCTDRRGTLFPILALVGDGDYLTTYTAEGRYVATGEESWMDLIPLTPELNKTYNGGHYKVIAHTPDLNPNHPWAVVALGDNYLFWVNDYGVSESGFIKLDL
jgi:hypothetical protein